MEWECTMEWESEGVYSVGEFMDLGRTLLDFRRENSNIF